MVIPVVPLRWVARRALPATLLTLLLTACPTPDPARPTISVTPATRSVTAGGAAIPFSATVVGSSATVRWSLTGPGSLAPENGPTTEYTPPTTVQAQETATLEAALAGTTASATATITITPADRTTGRLRVSIGGLPEGVGADVTVSGPEGYSQAVTATTTLDALTPGTYTVTSEAVTDGDDAYEPDVPSQPAEVTTGGTADVGVLYASSQRRFFVNPVSGSDDAAGTSEAPFRSVGKALATASSGDTAYLQSGTYDAETWPLVVPDGVRLEALVAGDAVLLSPYTGYYTALSFTGSGSAKNLRIHNFDTGIEATTGTLSLTGLGFQDIRSQDIKASGDAQVTLTNSTLRNAGSARGVALSGSAALTMTSGTISGGSSGVFVEENASATLQSVTVDGTDSTLYVYGGGSQVTLTSVSITNTVRTAVQLRDTAAQVRLEYVTINGAGEQGISAYGFTGALTIVGGSVRGAGSGLSGIDVRGTDYAGGTLTIEGTDVSYNLGRGVVIGDYTVASITNTTLTYNGQEGLAAFEPFKLTLRSSTVTNNAGDGVYLRGYRVIYPFTNVADFGTAADPGGNVIRGNDTDSQYGDAGMTIYDIGIPTINASGNYWNASDQGADQLGLYAVGSSLTGPTSGFPTNFRINASNRIQF